MSIELTPELAPEFAVTVRGYDRAQVDEYIDWLREWLSNATVRMESAEAESTQLRDQLRRLQRRVDDLEAETSGEPPRTIGALGERMTRILELAEEGAAAVRADAETEAERLLTGARAEAAGVAQATEQRQAELDSRLANVTERAQQTLTEAEARAADAVSRQMLDAETRAKEREAEAEQRARQLVEDAEQERARVLAQLTAEKTALDAHLAALVAQRDAVLAGLSKLQASLASTIVEGPPPAVSSAVQAARVQAASDDTAANDLGDAVARRQAAEDGRSHDSGDRSALDRASGGVRKFASAVAPRRNAGPGRQKDRTVLFDREAVEEEEEESATPPPPMPQFRRAGSQPEGSQRAGE